MATPQLTFCDGYRFLFFSAVRNLRNDPGGFLLHCPELDADSDRVNLTIYYRKLMSPEELAQHREITDEQMAAIFDNYDYRNASFVIEIAAWLQSDFLRGQIIAYLLLPGNCHKTDSFTRLSFVLDKRVSKG